jgi:hypothetical protein
MLELFARRELRPYPMRLPSTAGPCLGGIIWVLIFRKNLRIGAARPIGSNRAISVFKPAQTFFELGLFLGYLASQNRSHLFVQAPQLICGHGFESITFHERTLRCYSPTGQGALQRARRIGRILWWQKIKPAMRDGLQVQGDPYSAKIPQCHYSSVGRLSLTFITYVRRQLICLWITLVSS